MARGRRAIRLHSSLRRETIDDVAFDRTERGEDDRTCRSGEVSVFASGVDGQSLMGRCGLFISALRHAHLPGPLTAVDR